MSAAKRCID